MIRISKRVVIIWDGWTCADWSFGVGLLWRWHVRGVYVYLGPGELGLYWYPKYERKHDNNTENCT